ncbi:MAG: TonB-dependent receptor, partial [Maricaulaceae bacterium]
MLKRFLCGTASVVALGAIAAGPAAAQDDSDVIVVTGSYIAGTPEDAALPVDVFSQTELEQVGAPTLNELLRNIGTTQGLIGESNQFDTRGSQGNEGVTTINLRGLGSARTLVLINDRRHVGANANGVDVSMIPTTAIQRLEVLKDGAAALYGSDAIGGVVNFITRDGFEGLEVRASHQFIDGSDGDSLIGGIFGHSGDNYDWFVAAEYGHRSQLRVIDRDWALQDFVDNPQGGWSSIGNPATIINPNVIPIAQAINQAPVIFGQADPNCNALGGFVTPIASTGGSICRFQFTFFDNLIEEQDDARVFTRGTFDFGQQQLSLEAAYAQIDVPEYATSPAYPPQSLNDTRIPITHPALVDFFADNPAFAAALDAGAAGGPPASGDYIFWGRYTGVAGVNGQPETNQRLTEQYRLAASLSGDLFDGGLSYDLGVSYSRRDRELNGYRDMDVQNFAFALQGLGGPNCTPSTGTPGVGPCEYFNPFSTAIQTSATTGQANPNFDPAFANSPELLDWLVDEGYSLARNDLLVTDFIVSGETNWELSGGPVGFAVGAQARYEVFEQEISDNFNLNLNPCPFDDPFAVTLGLTPSLDCGGTPGQFGFLSGTTPSRTERTVYGGFAELALPVSDTFDVQLAARFEDYGGLTGSTFDPKVAARWQVTPDLTLRGSASSTFRGPPQPFLTGRQTALVFTAPTNAFKAHDIIGNPNLEPESAIATNLGAIYQHRPFTGSVDYWRFDFSDPLQIEDGNQILNAYIAADCADGGAGVGTADCTALRSHVFPLGV